MAAAVVVLVPCKRYPRKIGLSSSTIVGASGAFSAVLWIHLDPLNYGCSILIVANGLVVVGGDRTYIAAITKKLIHSTLCKALGATSEIIFHADCGHHKDLL
jgi:ABC-type xylose transport system permease subunit